MVNKLAQTVCVCVCVRARVSERERESVCVFHLYYAKTLLFYAFNFTPLHILLQVQLTSL